MKKNLTAILLACAAILAVSCSKESYEEPQATSQKGVERVINATAVLPGSTDKASLNTTTNKISWELSDQINVNGTNLGEIMLHNEYAKPTAAFGGTAHAIASGDREIYWAVYPTTLAGAYNNAIPAAFTASSLTFTLPAAQTFNSTANTLSGYTYMAGFANMQQGQTDVIFGMHNLGVVMHLNLTAAANVNANVEKIEFTTTDGALAGDFTVANDTVTVAPTASATKTLTVNLTDGTNNYINISNATDIYVALPPMTAKNLTMRIYNTDGYYTEKTSPSVTFRRSYIYHNTLTGINFNLSEDKYYFTIGTKTGKKVVFAPGNLQWSATNGGSTATTHRTAEGTAAGTWRFAEHQWSYVGFGASDGNVYDNNNVKCDNASIASNYSGWIDMFGFCTSGYNNKFPYMTSQSSSDYGNGSSVVEGTYYDFGKYNDIYNPKTHRTDAYGTWRLLSKAEWDTLTQKRSSASTLHATGKVNGIIGLILLPDNWVAPSGITLNTSCSGWNNNDLSLSQWEQLENNGAVFLPRCGKRKGTSQNDTQWRYGSSTRDGSAQNAYLYMNPGANPQWSAYDQRYFGLPVRLVKPYTGN